MIAWHVQDGHGGALTLHADGCHHLKPEAARTALRPSWGPYVVEVAPHRPRYVWTCRLCLARVRLLAQAVQD